MDHKLLRLGAALAPASVRPKIMSLSWFMQAFAVIYEVLVRIHGYSQLSTSSGPVDDGQRCVRSVLAADWHDDGLGPASCSRESGVQRPVHACFMGETRRRAPDLLEY